MRQTKTKVFLSKSGRFKERLRARHSDDNDALDPKQGQKNKCDR